jgi:hypothetical protein
MTTVLNPKLATPAALPILPKAYGADSGNEQAPANYKRVAVIVHHGMGQQVPYETIEGVAKSVWSQAGQPPLRPLVRYARLGVAGNDAIEPELVRAELRVETTIDDAPKFFDVHIYESYWAPLTEGQVTISDVIWFLLRAGWNGWLNTGFGKFQRWLFGQEQIFKLPKIRLMVILGLLLALIVSLVFINSVLAAAAASHAIGSPGAFPSGDMLGALTWDFLLLDVLGLIIAFAIFGLGGLGSFLIRIGIGNIAPRGQPRSRTTRSVFDSFVYRLGLVLTYLGQAIIYIAAGILCLTALLMACHVSGWTIWPYQPHPDCTTVSFWLFVRGGCWLQWILSHRIVIVLIWAIELVQAHAVRWTLIEYVGDVTAYIAAYSVSKFWKLRQDIRDAAMKVMRAVYRARTPDGQAWLYDKIIVVGHSLGSVIGYDTLNSLLLEAVRSNSPVRVPERTRMFLTFGSPLDKTAFLFRTLKDMDSEIREVGAAAVQPMIADYAYRPGEWVNLWSPADIISGELDYYDPPKARNASNRAAVIPVPPSPKRVGNSQDPEATTPLKAHVEYWKGRLLAAELWRAITT